MLSKDKIDANRRNARSSSGPRSPEGKATVARNACKHNLTSINIAIQGEDLEEFHHLLHETVIDLTPRSTVENALVQQIAYAEWKLLRIARWETDIINASLARREAHCQKLFSDTPSEALVRLHRYEAQIRRAWHSALREFRVQQKASPSAPASQQPASENPDTILKKSGLAVPSENDQTNPPPAHTPAGDPPATL